MARRYQKGDSSMFGKPRIVLLIPHPWATATLTQAMAVNLPTTSSSDCKCGCDGADDCPNSQKK